MTNKAISELTAAGALTGAELIELVQSGASVRSTVTAVTAVVATDNPAIADTKQTVNVVIANTQESGFRSYPYQIQTGGQGAPTFPAKAITSYLATLDRYKRATAAAANSPAFLELNFNNQEALSFYRTLTTGATAAGFDVGFVFGAEATAGSRLFAGVTARDTTPFQTGNFEPSAAVNTAGFGVDSTDTNLFFMHNDGSGAATKVDLGVSWASLGLKALRGEITCPRGGGNISYKLTVLDTGVVYSGSVSTNMPAIDVALSPLLCVNTGTTSAIMGVYVHKIVVGKYS